MIACNAGSGSKRTLPLALAFTASRICCALAEIPGVRLYGPPPERRAGIVSFNLEGVHPHDVAQVLDMDGVAIRAGHHCCQPLMAKLGVAATNRASFYLYSLPEEVDRLVGGVERARTLFA